MAIHPSHVMRNKIEPKASVGSMSQASNGPSHVMTLTITTTQSSINSDSRCRIARKKGLTSPYLAGDKVKLSRVTEKKVVHKKPLDYALSVPLAANVYRANSDELRFSKQNNKKVKKSVLTLPNESNADGIVCTVSDVNDVTEYNKDQRDRERKIKNRKRLPMQSRKPRIRGKDLYYDRDAQYCSQMNIDLDCSSTDMIKHYNGDGRRVPKKNAIAKVSETEYKLDPHDVWAVLRNINQFQFTPSPPMSDYSIQSRKKKRINRKRNTRKDARVIETCRTEEIAYISSFDVNRSRTSFSQASSNDRITVIDKQDEFSQFCQEFENKFSKNSAMKDSKNEKVQNRQKTGNQILLNKRNNKLLKQNCKPKEKENQLVPFTDKKVILNKSSDNKDVVKSTSNSHNTDARCLEYNEDILEKNDTSRLQLSPYNDTLCSVNSGSSKAGLHDFVNNGKAEGNKSFYSDESNQQLKGITKVVLSKAPDGAVVVPKRSNAPNRKPRLVTTMPSSMPPKLTQTEIKRRLANMKFPIVILGKDELGCSSIEVPLSEPVQFRGLDQHMWPFMVEWYNNDKPANVNNKSKNNNIHEAECSQPGKDKHAFMKTTNNNNLSENKVLATKEKKFYIYNTKKTEPKPIIAPETKIQPQSTKPKPIKQLRDKMLKLLYKKSVEQFKKDNNETGDQRDVKIDAATDTVKIPHQRHAIQLNRRSLASPRKESIQMSLSGIRHPWAKGKWASDFIDSVIKKVKTGIYYSQEKKGLCKKCCRDSKEASIQTALTLKSDIDLNKITKVDDIETKIVTAKQTSDCKIIPGFDDVLAPVEIKTLNMRQITVKHCLTNLLLQFDVSIPTEKKHNSFESHSSLFFTPLTLTDNNSKVIKCKTTILNAIMPAELCSIIPKMMRNISDFSKNLQVTFPPILQRKPDFQLATITELSQPNSVDTLQCSIIPFNFMSTKLRAYLAGNFQQISIKPIKHEIYSKIKTGAAYSFIHNNMAQDVLKDIKMVPLLCHQHLFYKDAIELTGTNMCNPSVMKITPKESSSKCMSLQPYTPPKLYVAPTFGIHNVIKLLQHICSKNIVVNFDFPKYFPVRLNDIKITLHPNIDVQDVSKIVQIDSLYNGFLNTGDSKPRTIDTTVNCIEYNKRMNRVQDKKQKSSVNLCHTKTKKKCFVRLYKKCKSTSNIAIERTTTAICKITDLDHFFQVLGPGKLLSSVFDGIAEKKILSFIGEMKNWITDISQRQAMLVLLLTNKKDTPNLVRYRPVLLQGIAVNRITRASELDMEIEVIETENLNKPQYEEMSHISASIQNDNLLEELYWIAKTTASDYQKPFDESSERLLKSLTEKRKKLNPSYLRVMARYVGLGLLKPPKK